MRKSFATVALATASILMFATACGTNGGPALTLSVASLPAGSGASASSTGLTLTAGSDTLVLTKAQIVVRKVELEKVDPTGAHHSCSDDAPGSADCHELRRGPMLVSLPLAAGASSTVTVNVEPGTYGEVEFEIHKVGDDPEDRQFVQANPDFADKSIRVEGTFNGQPFTYESRLDAEQEVKLSPPLEIVASAGSVNLTLMVDIGTWFRTASGGLVDPATANVGGAAEGLVKENIKSSLKAFEDDDHDGHDDHEGHG